MTSGREVYDEALIEKRSNVIGYAIDARRQRYPAEESYQYLPFLQSAKAIAGTTARDRQSKTTTCTT